jgi:hypothetical protein
MTSAWTKEADPGFEGSIADRFWQGLLGLGESDWPLVVAEYERQKDRAAAEIMAARRAAEDLLGPVRYSNTFDSGSSQAPGPDDGAARWAAGDAAVAITARRRLPAEHYRVLVGPVATRLPWLKTAGGLLA